MIPAELSDVIAQGLGVGGGIGGEVIVLYHDHVEEAETVVLAASGADGGFLKDAKAGGGLAGIEDDGGGAGDGIDEAAGEGGDGGEALEEVEGDPFGGEDGADGAGDFEDCLAGSEWLAGRR